MEIINFKVKISAQSASHAAPIHYICCVLTLTLRSVLNPNVAPLLPGPPVLTDPPSQRLKTKAGASLALTSAAVQPMPSHRCCWATRSPATATFLRAR